MDEIRKSKPAIKPGESKGKPQEPTRLAIPRSPSDTRRNLMSMDTFYAPTKEFPESLYLVYCAAIIDAILELYPASNDLYSRIVSQWGTPGCQSVIMLFEKRLAKSHNLKRYSVILLKTLASIDIPDNEDWKKQEENVEDWIRKYCNTPADVKKGKEKLKADNSIFMDLVLIFGTLGQYLKLDFNAMNEYRGGAKELMEQHKHSRRRDKIVRALRDMGFGLHYGDQMREGARLWVRARVFSNSLSDFAEKQSKSERDILQILEPFDEAAGYPRHPG